MKAKIIKILIGIIIIILIIISITKIQKTKENNNLKNIRLAEVTHSAFYAPLYVAIEKGYFKENNIDLELILTSGADKVSAAVLSNDVEIGFAGPESAIYIYNGGEEDYLITFSGLTKRDGQFIVSREDIKDFSLNNLKGKEILVGRAGGMPALNFLNALKNQNINPSDVKINTSVEFSALSGSFIAGEGDYVNLFEPNATNLVKEGYGYIVGNVGNYSGEVPYTAFYARKSYIEKNKNIIKDFTKSISQGLKFVEENSSEIIAKTILPQFPDISLTKLTTIVDNYKKYDSWLKTPYITEESYQNLEDMMIDANLIDKYVPHNELINNFYNE